MKEKLLRHLMRKINIFLLGQIEYFISWKKGEKRKKVPLPYQSLIAFLVDSKNEDKEVSHS